MYNFIAGYVRIIGRVNSFYYLLNDEYPPFDGEVDAAYPVRVNMPPPLDEYRPSEDGLAADLRHPGATCSAIVQAIIVEVVSFIGWFAILFTGKLPDGLFNPIRSASAYQTRAAAYFLLITEDWPPFSYEEAGAGARRPITG